MNELTALTVQEQQDYVARKAIIKKGIRTFVEVGESLADIRDRKLYRQEYATFDEFCEAEFGFKHSRAYQLIDSAQVYNNLSTIVDKMPSDGGQVSINSTIVEKSTPENGQVYNNLSTIVDKMPLPANEAQTRPLSKLTPATQAAAWVHTVTKTGGKQPTANQVERACLRYSKADQTRHKPKSSVTVESQVNQYDDFNQAGDYDDVTGGSVKLVNGFTQEQLVEMLSNFDNLIICPYCKK